MLKKTTYLTCWILVLGLLGAHATFGSLVIERRIAVGSDDVEQNASNGQMDIGSSDLEFPRDGALQIIGLRFTDLDIPSDAVILEAWLQFEAEPQPDDQTQLVQTILMAPKGLLGFLYWYALYPFHGLIFAKLVGRIAERAEAVASGSAPVSVGT